MEHLLAELKLMFAHVEYADGLATIPTQDIEAIADVLVKEFGLKELAEHTSPFIPISREHTGY